MDRLFLDADVLFSAAWRPGPGVARLWRVPGTVLFTSAFTAEEAARNLSDPGQQERLIQHLKSVRIVATREISASQRRGITLPAKDWPVLGGALAAEATHLITGDLRHFGRSLGSELLGVMVLTPAMYLSRWG